jgi:hypothetical protein
LEFTFADAPSLGLSFLQLTQDFALAPFGLTVNNVINISRADTSPSSRT